MIAGIVIVIPSLFSSHKTSVHRPKWAHLVKRKKNSHRSYIRRLHNSGVATIFLHCSRGGWHNRYVFSFQRNWPWYLKLRSKFSHYDISKKWVKKKKNPLSLKQNFYSVYKLQTTHSNSKPNSKPNKLQTIYMHFYQCGFRVLVVMSL